MFFVRSISQYHLIDIKMQQLDKEQFVPFLTKITSIKTCHNFIIIVFIQLLASFGFVIVAIVDGNHYLQK